MSLYGTDPLAYTLRPQQKKRGVFFSFHYDDIMRVNNVRNCGEFTPVGLLGAASVRRVESVRSGFSDRSLWESRKRTDPEGLKALIRNGVQNTSAVCVLTGTQTWERPWVRYEIARAVVDGRGLLAVHINGLRHHQRGYPDPSGQNPLAYMAVGKVQQPGLLSTPQYYLYEFDSRSGWVRYSDYTPSVPLPRYLTDPAPGYPMPLSVGTAEYDFVREKGHAHIGQWIDAAAQAVGR